MTPELYWLTFTLLMATLLWVPPILNRIVVRGIPDAMGYPEVEKPHSPWAERALKAHRNSVENIAIFAALILVAHIANISNDVTTISAMLFFLFRLAYYFAYLVGIPYLRTVLFAGGWAATIAIALTILGWI